MIPLRLRDKMSADPYYSVCARKGCDCDGRITWEHAFLYAGRQIQEEWAIIPLCWHHHLGKGLDKQFNHYLSLIRADISDLEKRYPKKNWRQYNKFLVSEYDKDKNKTN